MEATESTVAIRKFRVLDGSHRQGKKTYVKGQIVKSEKDLAKMFVGKFIEVGVVVSEEPEAAAPAKEGKKKRSN